jgi:hypothetical protein
MQSQRDVALADSELAEPARKVLQSMKSHCKRAANTS